MKVRRRIGFIFVALILIAGILWWLLSGRHPYADLRADQIQSASVRLIPPSVQYELSADQIEDLCRQMQSVVIYRTFSPEPMAGQFVEFTLTFQDGAVHTVQPFGTLISLDGIFYQTAYEPSEALNQFANQHIPT